MASDRYAVLTTLILLLLGGCSTAKPVEPSPAAPEIVPIPEPQAPQTDLEKLQQSLGEQYNERVGEAIIQETRDLALKMELMASLQEIRLARKGIKEIEAKEAQGKTLSLQENRDKSVWIRKYNSQSKELRELIEASAEMYWVDFRIFNRKELTDLGVRQLEEMRPVLSDACRLGREIIVAGFGCSIGGEGGTIKVSSIRAARVAEWIDKYTGCGEHQIANVGMGMIVEESYRSAAETPAGETVLAQNRHALVLVLRKESVRAPLP